MILTIIIERFFMKTLFLSLIVASSVFAAEPEQEQNLGNWTETFQTAAGPIVHTPTQTQMGFMTTGKGIYLEGKSINNVPLTAPLDLKTNSTRAQFVEAMKKSGIYTGN